MLLQPCKNCEERHRACHSDCDKYAEYRKEIDEANVSRRKSSEINACTRIETEKKIRHLRQHPKSSGGGDL